MPEKKGPPGYLEAQRKEGRTLHSRYLIPPPPTTAGYDSRLGTNLPNTLTQHELAVAQAKIDTFRKEQNGKGAWDNYKVNITAAYTVRESDATGIHDVIYFDTAPATYFQHRAGIDDTTSKETGRKLSHAGVMVIAITGNGNPKIVLSTRPDNVNLYPRTITATASGSWEGQPQTPILKLPDGSTDYAHLPLLVPPTPEDALNQMQAELHEETGLPLAVIQASQTKNLGIAEDSQKFHRDWLYMIRLPEEMTQERMNALHKEAKQLNNHGNDPMAGHLIFIDATPVEIEKYLTQLPTFWDGNADRALLAVGKMLLMEKLTEQGMSQEQANQEGIAWMTPIEAKIKEKRQERNKEVKAHRRATVHRAWKERRSAWGEIAIQQFNLVNREPVRNARQKARRAALVLDEQRGKPNHYNAHEDPKTQGGKDVKEALIEIGYPVISSNQSTPPSTH